jgi:methionine sulfoxide reductase heme-binding subunit
VDFQRPPEKLVVSLKVAVFVLALVPLARLVTGVFFYPEWLGANPAEFITRDTGDWALRLLLLTLAVTPARKILGWNWLVRFRRMLGLFAFFYVLVHFSSYVAFDQVFDVAEIARDIVKRPFITVGMLSLLLLIPLAATSTNGMVRRLGTKRWLSLHRLVYVIGPLAVLHFWWMVKRDLTEPIIYALILALLLGYRFSTRRARPAPARRPVKRPSPSTPS